MATLEDEVSAMRAVERALTKAASLPTPVRARVLGWGQSRVGELLAEVPDGPASTPPTAKGPGFAPGAQDE